MELSRILQSTTPPPPPPLPPRSKIDLSLLLNPIESHPSLAERKRKSSFVAVSEAKRPCKFIPILPNAKRQTKWSEEEDDLIIRLRGEGLQWKQAAEHLPGRTAIACRLHYQNYLEKREWDEGAKNQLAKLYNRMKSGMWANVAKELGVPWRTAEAMHWSLGLDEIARRAEITRQ